VTTQFTFTYHAAQQARFRSVALAEEWKERYPMLFEQVDLNLVRTQPRYHFFEWLSAVLIFEATGWLSLVEGYTADTHPQKRAKLREIVGEEILRWLDDHESGQPDLFVYGSRPDEWFFCEVKGGPDRERQNQREWTARFRKLLKSQKVRGERVRLIHLKEIRF
jgi:hypothetical protein